MRRERLVWITLATTLIALAAYLDWRLTQAPTSSGPAMNVRISAPEPTAFTGDDSDPAWPAISSDGQRLAFIAKTADASPMLWVRRLDEANARPLSGTENARMPFWSPDGEFIAFFAEGKLKKIPAMGGTTQIICESKGGLGGTWNQDEVIMFADAHPPALLRVFSEGGAPTELQRWHEDYRLSYPRFLPDGQQFLFAVSSSITPHLGGWYISTSTAPGRKKLLDNVTSVQYVQGYMLILRSDGRLVAQRFDLRTLTLVGATRLLAEGIGGFSASNNGIIAYRTARPAVNLGLYVNWLSQP